MQPLDFLAHVQQHQQERANQPTPEMVFMAQQFKDVVAAMDTAAQTMTSFMQTYHPTATVDNFPKEIKTPDIKEVVSAVKALETTIKPIEYDNSELVKGLKSIQDELKQLPKSIPDTDKAVVNSLNQLGIKLSADISKVLHAVLAQEVKPEVKVEKPDLKPLEKAIAANKPEKVDLEPLVKALKAVQKEVAQKPVPGTVSVPTDPLIKYAESDIDDVDASNTLKSVRYFGYTDNSGAWYIKRLDVSGVGTTGKSIRFAFGQSNYQTNWNNRANLAYAQWGI
jgi:hypothetical protein